MPNYDERFKEVLIYDLETSAPFGTPTELHKLRVFGAYSFKFDKYYEIIDDKKAIEDLIERHEYIMGFNNIGSINDPGYDNTVMFNNGFATIMNKYNDRYYFKNKTNIDLMQIFKKRAPAMNIPEGMLNDLLMRYSLDFISKTIGIVKEGETKLELDYTKLIPEAKDWSDADRAEIIEYTRHDIEITKKMYVWLEDYFEDFQSFVEEKDVKNKSYLTSSTAVFSYKSICKSLGMEEEYEHDVKGEKFGGGYVAFPAGEHFSGKIYCLDYNSLYPSIMHQCNIFSPKKGGWAGGGKFITEGEYEGKTQGKVEKLLKKWYEDRMQYKKDGDRREYTLKIQLNASYGAMANPSFKHICNPVGAADVTRIGRQWVKLARRYFDEEGYELIYSDTDSIYIVDKWDDKEKMLEVKDRVIHDIKAAVPFPYKHFDMGIDDEITDMWFFPGDVTDKDSDSEMDELDVINKPKGFMKKNYIYRTTSGKIKVKNLGVRKKSTSTITRKIFWDILVPRIKEERTVKFSESYFRDLIQSLLAEDISLAGVRYACKPVNTYKNPDSQLQANITKIYGSGIHFLIPVKKDYLDKKKNKLTAGIKKKFISVENFKKLKLDIDDIDLSKIWKELNYFVKSNQTTLDSFFA